MGFGGMVGRNDDRENEMQHLGRITKSVFRQSQKFAKFYIRQEKRNLIIQNWSNCTKRSTILK